MIFTGIDLLDPSIKLEQQFMLKEETEKQLMNERHFSNKEMLQLEHENSIREIVEIQVQSALLSIIIIMKPVRCLFLGGVVLCFKADNRVVHLHSK